MKQEFLQTMSTQLVRANPELGKAHPERIKAKARRSAWVVVFGVIAATMLAGGCWVTYLFAKSAIAQHQELSLTLMGSLLIPLVPGSIACLIVALRNDPEAGGVLSQVVGVIGAARNAVTGKSQ